MKTTLNKIRTELKKEGQYILTKDNPALCPHVNGLVNIYLSESDLTGQSNVLTSPIYNIEEGLCYREGYLNLNISQPYFNSCKNSIVAIDLAIRGKTVEANRIINALKASPLYNSKKNLFYREYHAGTKKVNKLILTQSNLWAALALVALGRTDEGEEILKSLEREKYRSNEGLFISQDCNYQNSPLEFMSDDQALAAILYLNLGHKEKAENLMQSLYASKLFDARTGLFNRSFSKLGVNVTKSTYKNSLIGIALGKLSWNDELRDIQTSLMNYLYDSEERLFNQSIFDKTKIPDNSALALMAINYSSLRHIIF